ncbi:MAG: NTP transferase domain-containing protein [Desulfobacterales bacterium]|jgi:CTP:molybdopterin cytidylyltransferase MocA
MPSSSIAAVILSAGASSRMGAFKPLLGLGAKTLLEHVVETARSAGVEEIRVVVGHRAGELAPVVEKAGAEAIFNRNHDRGMFSSVCAGIKSLDPAVAAFFLLPVDIALVRPATFRRLAAAWVRHPGRIVYPVFAGKRGHPPLVPAALIPAILQSQGDGGLQKVLEGYEDRALDADVADENILFDVDRPQDYETARDRFVRLSDPSAAECEAILFNIHPVGEAAVRHGRAVQQASGALCRALNRAGAGIDENRVMAGALLHDIAKGAPDHAAEGGRMLAALGFAKVGAIVAAHTDLPEEEIADPKEAAVVYLADKLVSGARFVSLQSRFDAAMERFGSDPAARAAVERRRKAALAVKQKVEERTGLTVEEILSDAGIRCGKTVSSKQ